MSAPRSNRVEASVFRPSRLLVLLTDAGRKYALSSAIIVVCDEISESPPPITPPRALARCAQAPDGVSVLGPAEAPLAVLRGRHRMRLIVKTERDVNLQDYLRDWLKRAGKPKGSVRVAVDVDPQSFL